MSGAGARRRRTVRVVAAVGAVAVVVIWFAVHRANDAARDASDQARGRAMVAGRQAVLEAANATLAAAGIGEGWQPRSSTAENRWVTGRTDGFTYYLGLTVADAPQSAAALIGEQAGGGRAGDEGPRGLAAGVRCGALVLIVGAVDVGDGAAARAWVDGQVDRAAGVLDGAFGPCTVAHAVP